MPNLKEILRLYGNSPDQGDIVFDKTKSNTTKGLTAGDIEKIVQNTKPNLPIPVFDETNGERKLIGKMTDVWVEEGDLKASFSEEVL